MIVSITFSEWLSFLQVQKKALNFVSDIEESLKMNHEVTVWLHKELKNVRVNYYELQCQK